MRKLSVYVHNRQYVSQVSSKNRYVPNSQEVRNKRFQLAQQTGSISRTHSTQQTENVLYDTHERTHVFVARC